MPRICRPCLLKVAKQNLLCLKRLPRAAKIKKKYLYCKPQINLEERIQDNGEYSGRLEHQFPQVCETSNAQSEVKIDGSNKTNTDFDAISVKKPSAFVQNVQNQNDEVPTTSSFAYDDLNIEERIQDNGECSGRLQHQFPHDCEASTSQSEDKIGGSNKTNTAFDAISVKKPSAFVQNVQNQNDEVPTTSSFAYADLNIEERIQDNGECSGRLQHQFTQVCEASTSQSEVVQNQNQEAPTTTFYTFDELGSDDDVQDNSECTGRLEHNPFQVDTICMAKSETEINAKKQIVCACEECDALFRMPCCLLKHVESAHDKTPYVCPFCGFATVLPIIYRSHMKLHKPNRRISHLL